MNSKFISFLILFLAFGFIAEAQVSGYLGKRFVAGYNAGISPVMMNNDHAGRPKSITLYHEGSIGYVLSRSRFLSFNFQHSRTGFFSQQYVTDIENPPQQLNEEDYSKESYFMNYNRSKFSLKMHRSLRGAISPIGAYVGTTLFASRSKAFDPGRIHFNINQNPMTESPGYDQYLFPSVWDVGMDFSLGRRYALSDRFLIDIGLEFTLLTYNGFFIILADWDFDYESREDNIKYSMRERDYQKSLVRVYLGINFLTF